MSAVQYLFLFQSLQALPLHLKTVLAGVTEYQRRLFYWNSLCHKKGSVGGVCITMNRKNIEGVFGIELRVVMFCKH